VGEKRQLLNLVFQNLQLRGVNLSVSVQEPFLTMLDCKDHPTNWMKFIQKIFVKNELYTELEVDVASVDLRGRPKGWPAKFIKNISMKSVS
jgi:hypothetical protein